MRKLVVGFSFPSKLALWNWVLRIAILCVPSELWVCAPVNIRIGKADE